MQNRNPAQNQHHEPKVIALAAAKENRFSALLWQIGLTLLAYSWMSFALK